MKKILLILFVFLFVSLTSGYSNSNLTNINCYQEYANQSNTCSPYSTGTYTFSGAGTDIYNMIDGDYSTYGFFTGAVGETRYLDITYELQSSITSGTWNLKLSSTNIQNLSVDNCIIDGTLRLRYMTAYATNTSLYCYNNTAWYQLYLAPADQYVLWDEGFMSYNFSKSIENLTFIDNQNITRYLSIPENTYLTRTFLDIYNIPIIDRLVNGYLKLNETSGTTAVNYKNGSANFSISTGVTLGQPGVNGFDNAYRFNSSAHLTSAPFFELTGQYNYTVSMWINKTSNSAGIMYLMDCDNGGYDFSLYIYPTGYIYYHNTSISTRITGFNVSAYNNQWVHILLVKEHANSNLSLYVNGAIVDSITNIGTFGGVSECVIGRNRATSTGYFNGSIDEIIYSNRAFSAEEISELYNYGTTGIYGVANINLSVDDNSFYYNDGIESLTTINNSNLTSYVNDYLSACTILNGFCNVPIQFHSDYEGILQYSNLIFDNHGFIENSINYSNNTIETQLQNYSINISYDSSEFDINSTLVYNGTEYGTVISEVGYNAIINSTINVPIGTGNKSIYFKIGLTNDTGTYYFNSTIFNQTVELLNMSLCNNPYKTTFLNFTFHNETLAGEAIKATIDSTFVYSLSSDLAVNKTFTYSNAVAQTNYSFCFTPNATIYVSADVDYDNVESQQRTYTNISMVLSNNSAFVQDLLLLPNGAGIYITFLVTNTYGQKLEGAFIDVKQTAGLVPVESKYTDSTGAAAFWLSTSTSYTITTSLSGYVTESTGITPTSSPVTILLTSSSSSGGSPVFNPVSDIYINVAPRGYQLLNNTDYVFNFNISSDRDFDEYGFSLWNKTTQLTSVVDDNDIHGSNLSTSYNTGNQSYIIMKYYYIIDGNEITGKSTWTVVNTDGTDFSIANALGNLDGFIGNSSEELFGIKRGTTNGDFTLAIIVFIILLFGAGTITYKYGVTSVTATMFVILSILIFLDVGAGIVPQPLNAVVPHFLTWVVALITGFLFAREVI